MVHERPAAVRSGGVGGVRKIDQAKPLFKEKLTDSRTAARFPGRQFVLENMHTHYINR